MDIYAPDRTTPEADRCHRQAVAELWHTIADRRDEAGDLEGGARAYRTAEIIGKPLVRTDYGLR